MKRIIFLCILSLGLGLSLSAQKMWEGTGVAGRFGDFPHTGFYGASNIFPRNSLVNVQNISNGKIVQIIISDALEDPALFLLLSRQAADALEMDRSDTAHIRVSLAATTADPLVPSYADLPYSDDPEVNPASRAGDVNAGVEKNPPPEVAAALPDEEEDEPETSDEETPSISSRVPASGSEDLAIKEDPFEELPDERLVASGAEDPDIVEDWVVPDVETATAPEDTPSVADLPGEPEETAPEPEEIAEAETEEPEPETITEAETEEPEPETITEAEEPEPETITEAETEPETELETIVSLEPAEMRPPSSEALDSIIAAIPETAPEADKDWAGKNLPLVTEIRARSFYLQVASSTNPARVKPVVDSIREAYPRYPVVVTDATGSDPYYRVMVGPLREDERGLALRQIRAQGFKDAFLKENK
ncbi:MAG: SPOR domain-containing protein [Spirochaetaceae bacterium]|nr:SPOR domain-containing protein [Spirochaetaceae bacterium]